MQMMVMPLLPLFVIVMMVALPPSINGLVPPKTPVLTGFEPAVVSVGSYRELVCDASQPDAGTITYKWYKYSTDWAGGEDWESKGLIGTSQKYVPNTVTENSRGRYKCRATNSAGRRDSEWGDLYVYTPRSLYSVSVSPAKPAIGSTFTLYCYIPNASGLTVNWLRKADASSADWVIATANSKGCHDPVYSRYSWSSCSPSSFSSSPISVNLQITNAQPSDSGYWTCKDINLSCQSNPIKIVVQAPPGTPQINGFPSGLVTAGTQLNLKCVASPSGDTYDWYKDGTIVTTSLSYDFLVTKESVGVYKCEARNSADSATSSDKTLEVYYMADSVVVSSGKTSSHVGEKDKFTCTVTGGSPTPTLKIYFKRSGGTPVEVTQGQDIVMAKEDNQAEYYCEAKVTGYPALDMTSSRKTYNVTFQSMNVSYINNPTAAVQVGQKKMFTCETDESNPITDIKWYQYWYIGKSWRDITTGIASSERNGAYGGKVRISEWTVKATKAMNRATVRCKSNYYLTGHTFTANADTTMYVKFNPSQIKMIQSPPTTVHEGQLITFICETDSANPVAEITFHRKRRGGTWKTLTTGITSAVRAGEYGMIRKSTLTVTANRLGTPALFKCEVNKGSFQVKQTTTVDVYFPPTVKLSSNLMPVKEGDTLILTCTASGGNPTIYTYKWFYKNKEIPNETSRDYNITNIQYTQSGTYTCQAINYSPGDIVDVSINIDILYKAKWNPELPEVFTIASKTNTPMKFVLHVIANPSPPAVAVTWFFPNKTAIGNNITLTAAKVNATTYTLSKASVGVEDYGNYTVNVTNAVGLSTFTFELEKTGPPDPPCCLTLVSTTAVSLTLTFTSNFAGGSVQTFTVENKTSGGNEWDIAVKGIADPGFGINVTQKIAGLDSNTTYGFRVNATNADGDSGYEDILEAKTEAAPNVTLTVEREDNQATASWSKLTKKYTKIQIRFCPVKGGSCSFHDVPDPTTLESSFPVKEGNTYNYSMIIFDGEDQVFVSATMIVPPSQPPNPPIGAIAGGVGGFIIIAVVLALVFILKKRRAEKETRILSPSDKNGNANEGQVNLGFTDLDGRHNGMNDGLNSYELDSVEMTSPSSSIQIEAAVGEAEYAVVEKGSKKPLIGDTYAEVNIKNKRGKKKGGKKGSAPPQPGEQAYADVDFTKKLKKGEASVPAAGPEGTVYAAVNKKEKAPDLIAEGDVYAVVSAPSKSPKPGKAESDDQAVYANVPYGDEEIYEDVRKDEPTETGYRQPKEAYQIGVDGTIYSQVHISLPKNPDVIRGIETIEEPYASVDFTRQAPPLPKSSHLEEV